MNVFVNDRPVAVFDGARVSEAVNKYYCVVFKRRAPEKYRVYDGHGNQVMPGGSLSENDRLYIK
jgi:hypothetical protein